MKPEAAPDTSWVQTVDIKAYGKCCRYHHWPWWRKLMHIHSDGNWQSRGLFRYFQCYCGARRVQHYVVNLMGPVEPGWPEPEDRHGEFTGDSGWRFTHRPAYQVRPSGDT